MQIGKPLHEYVVEPLELPEPLRTAPSIEPEFAPERPEKVAEPEPLDPALEQLGHRYGVPVRTAK